MNTTLNNCNFIVLLLLTTLITSCGMTPEKNAERELIAKENKQKNEVQAKGFYFNLNNHFSWHKSITIPTNHKKFNYEWFGKKKFAFNEEFIWEKGAGKRNWNGAFENCNNANLLDLNDWRLPTVSELKKFKWDVKSNDRYTITRWYWSSKSGWNNRWGGFDAGYSVRFKGQNAIVDNSAGVDSWMLASLRYTRCIHKRDGIFNPFSLYETAQEILKLKKPTENKIKTTFPTSIKNKVKEFNEPKQGEFENRSDYNKRFMGLLNNVNAYNRKLQAEFDKAYAKAKSDREYEYSQLLIGFENKSVKHKADSLKEAFYVIHGKPKLKNVLYNADLQVFTMNVISEYGDFNQQLKIPLSVKYAPKFKKLITVKSFSPTVELEVRNGEVFVTGIKEIADPALIVERDEYNKAKQSITKLNTFIKKYPNSILVVTAKKQIKKLQHIAEQKRLAAIELAKDNADGEIIGTDNLEGAKFIAGRIWQDQPINKRFDVKFSTAKNYCKELNLLGSKGWRLPSKSNYLDLGENFHNFNYVANKPGYVTPYFTRDENCSNSGFFAISKQNCVVTAYPKISAADKTRSKDSFRCVLSSYKYNKHAKKQESKYLSQHTLDGYINAFMATGDDTNIRKAFDLAKTDNDLAKVEMALIKYFGLHDVFSLKGSLITKEGSDANRGEIDASLLLNMISSSGNAEFKYEVFPNANSTVPLKYGKYKVRLKVKLAMTYQTTMKKALFGLDLGTSNTKVKEREFEVILSPINGWKASGTVDFGSIMQGSKGAAFVFKMETKLGSIKPSFDLISIERF